jgi:hypothetical protein
LLRRERYCKDEPERQPADQKKQKTNAKSRVYAHLNMSFA